MTTPTTFRELARENTGAHLLDSGGAYGRQYDKPVPDEKHPLQYARAWGEGPDRVDLLISMPTMLDEQAPIDERETQKFHRWAQRVDPTDDCSWFELAERYIARRGERKDDGWETEGGAPFVGNTYNEDNELDQDFWFAAAGPYTRYAMVCTHNGCDARGGYSRPVVVEADDGIADALCALRLDYYCGRCQSGTEDGGSYQAEEDGWKLRRNKCSVGLICPTCHKVAFRLPIQNDA